MYKVFIIIIIAISLFGCSGRVVTTPISSLNLANNSPFNGIVVKEKRWYKKTFTNHLYKNSNGEITTKCTPNVYSDNIELATPAFIVQYKHGFLESYKFNLELNEDGSLKLFGSESTPDKGETLKNLVTAAKDAATIAAPVSAAKNSSDKTSTIPPLPDCNEGDETIDSSPIKLN